MNPGGKIESVLPTRKGLGSVCPKLQRRVLNHLQRVYLPDDPNGPYHENPDSEDASNMETSVWALVCLQQLRCTDQIERVRNRIAANIDQCYDAKSNTYQDDDARHHNSFGAWHLHNDVVSRIGLSILQTPARPSPDNLSYLKYFPWAQPPQKNLQVWLVDCWRRDPRAATKEIFQYLLLYCTLRHIHSGEEFDDHVEQIMTFLESKRDPQSGFIGAGPGVDLGWAMRGYRNFAVNFLWPMGVPESMPQHVIESTLACQRNDGLFHDGGMCANMDAMELLVEYCLQTRYRYDDVIRACRRCVTAILKGLSLPCGGFRFNLTDCPHPESEGYGSARVTNGTAFFMYALRFWQAIDPAAREDLGAALDELRSAAQ